MLLTTVAQGGHLKGTLTQPHFFTEEASGAFVGITGPVRTRPVMSSARGSNLVLQIGVRPDIDKATIALDGKDHLRLDFFGGQVPPWVFERVLAGREVAVASDWPVQSADPTVNAWREQLRESAAADAAARDKARIHDADLEELADDAKPMLLEIFGRYGWPAISTFGSLAESDFWLLVQHESEEVQALMLDLLRKATELGEAPDFQYAYLFDRVETGQGRAQHWGTQSRCEQGRSVLYPVDDVSRLDERRKQVGLGPIERQTDGGICARAK